MSTPHIEVVKIYDSKGFYYEVKIIHSPEFGFSTAYYRGYIIGQVELSRILKPIGDDDREWETYEQRFSEWKDEIKSNIEPICKRYFETLNQLQP